MPKLIPKFCVSTKESQQPIQKNPISTLQEYCQQRKTQPPFYDIQKVDGSGFYYRVTLEGKMYLGSTRPSKKEAKQSAAEKAIEIHISTSTPDDTLPSSEVITSNRFVFMQHYIYYSGPHKTHIPDKTPSDSYVQQLKVKYFDRKSVPFSFRKSSFVTKPVDGGFQCVLSIPRQRDFKSAVLPSKSAAENDAAKCALNFFKL